MAVLNPNFEDKGSNPGEAAHWTLLSFTALERIAGFGPSPHKAWEDFERWTKYLPDFDSVGIAIAFFDPLAEGFEDFEDAWNNEFYITELPAGHVMAAPFGGGEVEDMESAWRNNIYLTDWSGVPFSTGRFDGETREDYEEQWKRNHLFAWTWSQVSSVWAMFDSGGDSNEDFNNGWTAATTI